MNHEPVVSRESEREWETWEDESQASIAWKTLISGGVTRSESLTLGVARIPPGKALDDHSHRQAEVYLVLEGSGLVRVNSETRPIETGAAVFIPGGAIHSCENTGRSNLRVVYVIDADSFDEVEYVFEN